MEKLMDKLRCKQYRPWNETGKSLKQCMLNEKHFYMTDNEERLQLQKCVDHIQKSIKASTAQGMVERLDTITRQLGLKLTKDQKMSTERKGMAVLEVFISSDMFYVEVIIESNGTVQDVKVAHHGDPMSCLELRQVLQKGDFDKFASHLEGLISIYQLNCEKAKKQKAYMSLQALEKDLSTLSELQNFIVEPRQLVHKSPVGVLVQREGGFPMTLTYFVSPYDLIDVKKNAQIEFKIDNIVSKKLGQSVSITMDNSSAHKLQTGSLITNNDGKSMPVFGPLNQLNSVTLPACFTMKLSKPMAISLEYLKKIQHVTSVDIPYEDSAVPLVDLLAGTSGVSQFQVRLPDQSHSYHMDIASIQAVMVTSIPFTHPTHVPQVLVHLRNQCLFNTLINSCIRPNVKLGSTEPIVFELSATSLNSICVSFEHPLDNESLVSLEISLNDILNLKCKMHYNQQSDVVACCNEELASKILQASFSIPVLMRSVIKKAQSMHKPANSLQHSNNSLGVHSPAPNANSFMGGNQNSRNASHGNNDFDASHDGDNQMPLPQPTDLFDLANLSQQGGLSLNMLADDSPSGGGNFYYPPQGGNGNQGGLSSNGSGGGNNGLNGNMNMLNPQLAGGGSGGNNQRKRSREDDFLENSLGSAGGGGNLSMALSGANNSTPSTGGQRSSLPQMMPLPQGFHAESGAPSLNNTNTPSVNNATPPSTEPTNKRIRSERDELNSSSSRDSKNLQIGGDSSGSPPMSSLLASTMSQPPPPSIPPPPASSSSSSTTPTAASSSISSSSKTHHKESSKSSSKSSDDKRNSSSSSSSRDKEKRKDKGSTSSSSKSSSSKSSGSKDKERSGSSSKSSSSSKDREKSSNSKSSSSSGLNAIVDKLHQNVKTDSYSSGSSPGKYGNSSSASVEGQFTVKSSSSSQGIKLTINKTSSGGSSGGSSKSKSSSSNSSGGGSGSASSSKHSRDSPKPKIQPGKKGQSWESGP